MDAQRRSNQNDLVFLGAMFLVVIAGVLLGGSIWIVVPFAIVLGVLAARLHLRWTVADPPPPRDLDAEPDTRLALEFASALVHREFDKARSALTRELQQAYPVDRLRDKFHAMYRGYAESEPQEVDPEYAFRDGMADWPSRRPEDLGWVYVAIVGDDFSEGVSVTVARIEGELRIRDIEWGRP